MSCMTSLLEDDFCKLGKLSLALLNRQVMVGRDKALEDTDYKVPTIFEATIISLKFILCNIMRLTFSLLVSKLQVCP